MKILLDENFPLTLYRRLRERGYDAEHIIVLGRAGSRTPRCANGWRANNSSS